ncbi:hypothetical protein AAG906_007514 [Vitis piasezkii]
MVETSRDWSEKLPFALWAYRTSFRTSIGATPYSLVYGMEAVLLVEIEMRSLRVALEQHISEAEWAHDPRGKFRPSWSGPYVIRDLTREGAAWLTDLDGNQFIEPVNVDQLKKFYSVYHLYSPARFSLCDDDAPRPDHLAHMVLRYLTLRTWVWHYLLGDLGLLWDVDMCLHYWGYRGSHIVFPFSLLASGMLPSLHAGFGSLYMYAGILFRLTGHNSFLSPLVTFVSLSYRAYPFFPFVSGDCDFLLVFDLRLLRVIWQSSDVILGISLCYQGYSVVPRHRARVRSPIPPFSKTHWTLLRTRRIPPFPVLARTLLRYSSGFHHFPVPAWTLLRYSPGFHTFPVLARIPPFPGTCPNPSPLDSTLFLPDPSPVLAGFHTFRYSPDSTLSTCPNPSPDSPNSTLSRLARTLLPRIPPFPLEPFSGTSPDSTIFQTVSFYGFLILPGTFCKIFKIFCNRSAGWQPVHPVQPVHRNFFHRFDQLASGSAGSAGSLSQLSKLKKLKGVSWPCKSKRSNEGCGSHADEGNFGAEGEGTQEAQILSSSSSYAFSPSSSSFLPFDMKIVLLGCG